MIETKRLLLREYTWKIIMRKRIILIGIVIITILSVIGFSTYRIKNIRAENYRIANLYELQNAAFEIYGTYEERCRFQTSEKIELSMLVVDLYAYNYNRSDEQLRLAQVKENGKLAGKMLVMVESSLEVHKTDSSLNSFTLNYFFNILSHNRISPLSAMIPALLLYWFVRADKKLGTAGAQIDLIIDRRDRVINLCEMKFSLSEYTIDKDYDETLRKRIETFRKNTKTKKAVQIVFVTTYGVESNQYSGIVQKQVTLDDLFKAKEI